MIWYFTTAKNLLKYKWKADFPSRSSYVTVHNQQCSLKNIKIKHWQMGATLYTGLAVQCHLTWQPSQNWNRGESQLLSRTFSPLSVSCSPTDTHYPIHPSHVAESTILVMFNLFPSVIPVFLNELSKWSHVLIQ